MTDPTDYTPPRVWTWQKPSGGTFASINRPIAGATHERALPVGRHPLQLYSLATPNGVKVTVMLEELQFGSRGHVQPVQQAISLQVGDHGLVGERVVVTIVQRAGSGKEVEVATPLNVRQPGALG